MKLVKQNIHKLDFFIFCASVFTLPQSIKLSSKLLFISLVVGILRSLFRKEFNWIRNHKQLLIVYLLFFVYISVQGIVIDGLDVFLNSFEKHYAPYLVFLLLPVFYNDRKQIKILPKVFISGLLFTFTLIISMSIIEWNLYDRVDVLNTFDVHHLYISLFILFAINYLFTEHSRVESNKQRLVTKLMILILILFLFFFKSKAAIGVLFFLIVYHIIGVIKWNTLRIIGFLSIVVILGTIFNKYFYELYLSALDFRLKIWNAASNVVSQNLVFGYGASNEYFQLNTAHFLRADYDFLDSNYNAHNQYLSFLLRFGVIGLLLMLLTYFIPVLRIAHSFKKEYVGFLIIVLSMAFIESLFNRHHGIVFCTVMLYYYNTMDKNEDKE